MLIGGVPEAAAAAVHSVYLSVCLSVCLFVYHFFFLLFVCPSFRSCNVCASKRILCVTQRDTYIAASTENNPAAANSNDSSSSSVGGGPPPPTKEGSGRGSAAASGTVAVAGTTPGQTVVARDPIPDSLSLSSMNMHARRTSEDEDDEVVAASAPHLCYWEVRMAKPTSKGSVQATRSYVGVVAEVPSNEYANS
jgi:hypothetical protein